jgi:hypothetical protein
MFCPNFAPDDDKPAIHCNLLKDKKVLYYD